MQYDIEKLTKQIEEKMTNTLEYFSKELTNIRTGKASPSLIEDIMIDCYGSKMQLKNIASINTPELRQLTVQAWDVSNLTHIEKAIIDANIGLTPNNDGQILRLNLPELTEERRKELCKGVHAKAEDAKIEIRNARRDGNDFAKKSQKQSDITEDDLKQTLDEIQKLTNKYCNAIQSSADSKEKELLTV